MQSTFKFTKQNPASTLVSSYERVLNSTAPAIVTLAARNLAHNASLRTPNGQ